LLGKQSTERVRQAKLSQQRFVTRRLQTFNDQMQRAKSHFCLLCVCRSPHICVKMESKETNKQMRCECLRATERATSVCVCISFVGLFEGADHTQYVFNITSRPRLFLSRENRHRQTSMKLTHCLLGTRTNCISFQIYDLIL
jgi:hypothetical protein